MTLRQEWPHGPPHRGDDHADQVLTDDPFALVVGTMLDRHMRWPRTADIERLADVDLWSTGEVNVPGRQSPPKHLGDYPHGVYWSAYPSPGYVAEPEEPDYTVDGRIIKFMWDYGVSVPLWTDGDGLLPDEPEWLRRALGLSDSLIDDLSEWGNAMDNLDANPPLRTEQAYRDLDQRARSLVARLQEELGSRFTVRYEPW